jgi:hypothetical protein
MTKESVILNRIDKPFQYLSFSPDQIDKAFDLLSKDHILYPVPHSDGDYIYRIIDTDLYFLLYFLEDLFTEYVMPVMRKIWKYLRNPTSEERKWLILVEGETRANRIIIEDTEHRHEIVTTLKNKKSEKTIEIKSKVRSIQEELNGDMKTYGFIIKRYKSLQHIFEIMFPEFLQRLAVR